jgi:hypothetical protein
MVTAYKQLKDFRTDFDKLFLAVDQLTLNEKTARDLETRIDQERNRMSANNFEQVKADLESVQAENIDLINKIKSIAK